MKKILPTLLALALIFNINAQSHHTGTAKIDAIVNNAMSNYGVPGFSLAIIQNGSVVHKTNYGQANVEHDVQLSDESIFRVYSITKIFVAVGIMKLVEDGKVNLTDPLTTFNLNIPHSWGNRKIQHLLTHSSGFPDMAPIPDYQNLNEKEAFAKVSSSPLLFKAGSRYSYNQTNFYLLQKIIEEVSEKSFSDFILEHQFTSANKEVFFSTDSRHIVRNRVTPYFPFATGERIIDHPYLQDQYFEACNGMNITLDEFIKWDRKFSNDEFIGEESKLIMLSEFDYTESDHLFAYSWDKKILNQHPSYGFTGSLVTAYRIFPKDGISIILLGNGMGEIFDIDDVVNDIANAIDPDIINQHKVVSGHLLSLAEEESLKSYKEYFQEIIDNPKLGEVELESIGNSIGYYLLQNEKHAIAVEVLKLNVEYYPESWNAYDSLGEAYMIVENKEKSIENYEKSIVLNPDNQYGKDALKKLRSK